MSEQWRVAILLGDTASAGRSGLRQCKRDLAREMQDRTGVVVVGVPSSGLIARLSSWLALGDQLRAPGDSPVSAFTGNRAAAEEAARVAQQVAGEHGLTARVSVECWRPVKRQWEEASAVSERDLAEEHDYQQREDRRVSVATGVAQWRVRVKLRTHRDTVALAQWLSSGGHQVVKGWNSLVAGAESEDEAYRLAEQARQVAPPGADVVAERADTPDYTDDPNFSGGMVT